MRSLKLLLVFTLLCIPVKAVSQITVSDDITENTTWSAADSPVTVSQTITVQSGAVLTIEPGVTVLMGAGNSIFVEGALVAAGTEADKITFTSASGTPSPGDWGSIEFRNTANAGSEVDHLIVEYGAGGERTGMIFYTTGAFGVNISNSLFRNSAVHGINLRASSPQITNSEFTGNNGYGIFTDLSLSYVVENSTMSNNAVGGIRVPINSEAQISNNVIDSNPIGILIDNGGRPLITNNQITDNGVGIRIVEVGATKPVISDNTISGNTDFGAENLGSNLLDARFNFWGSALGPQVNTNPSGDGDRITENNIEYTPWRFGAADLPVTVIDSNIEENTTWEEGNVYLLTSNVNVTAGNTLTIEPGTVVKFGAGRSMTVTGQLIANGTEQQLIFFTSERDDAVGGDSNGDGDATVPAPNDWLQINISAPGSEISHSVIRYGGSTTSSGVINANAPVALSDIIVSNNFRNGVYSSVNQSGWSNIRTIDNSIYGIYIFEAALSMTGGESALNGSDGLRIRSAQNETLIDIDGFVSSDNGANGIRIESLSNRQGTRINSLTNSVISGNSSNGLLLEFSLEGSQLFADNTIENNSGHGVSLQHNMEPEDIVFEGNTFLNNGQTGVRSDAATFIDNVFEGNRFGIGAWRSLGHIYTDGNGVDGNTFSGNTYPGAIALYAESLRGTLSATVPASFEHPVYILATGGTGNSPSDVLVIEAGVTIKTAPELVSATTTLRLDGQLIAEGTQENPIVFTSLYDHDFGGDVSRIDDSSSPARGNWGGLRLHRGGGVESVLRHVYFRYARTGLALGDVQFASPPGVVYANTFEDIWVDNNSFNGLEIREAAVTMERLRATDNTRSGVELVDGNSNNGFVARAIIRNSEILNNGGTNASYAGLLATSGADGAAFTEISNTVISGNSKGVKMDAPSLPITLLGNLIEGSASFGVEVNSPLSSVDVAYIGNTVLNNTQSGILSTEARFIDNVFEGNRFGIGAWRSLGHIYTDGNGVDGNTFSGNTYPGAIALYAESLRGTLSATVPASFEHPVYILATGGTGNSPSDVLVIEAGVTIKTAPELVSATTSLRLDGQLIAEGTQENPIVFTSLYDHDFGGDVSRIDDSSSPARGNWGGLRLHRGGGVESVLRHVYFRYARTGLALGDVQFASPPGVVYANTFEDIWVDNNSFNGLEIREAAVTMERLRATDNTRSGVELVDGNSNNGFVARAIIRNSEILNNGGTNASYAGLLAASGADGAAFTEISNTVISGNSRGVVVNGGTLPSTFQGNQISDNEGDGLFARLFSVETDTSLTLSGNTITGHTSGTGAIITRAIVSDNTFENNVFPIGLMGELSREGSANEDGTIFENNTIGEHTYQDAIALYSTSNISLNGRLGYSWPESFQNRVFVPVTATTFVTENNRVEVAPGSVFKLGYTNSNQMIDVRGELIAIGDVDERIVFTSLRDDSFGGDTNRDENATLPQRNDWGRIEVRGSGSDDTIFRNAIVRYGQYNLYFHSTSAIFEDGFSSNAVWGFYSTNSAAPTIRNSDIHSNQWGIDIISNSGEPHIHLNNIYNNDNAGLRVARNVTAIDNYWGDSTGPFVDQGDDLNLDGQGDRIIISGSNNVIYRPFLFDRTGVLLGDVSENGSISAFDASLILQYLVDLITLEPTQLAAADVSGDGSVSALDASIILQYVVGIISGFPGAGKLPEFNPEELFELETILTDQFYEVLIRSTGMIPLMGGEIRVSFPDEFVESVEYVSTPGTSDWSVLTNSDSGSARLAMASISPFSDEGEFIHIRFHIGENGIPDIGAFKIEELVFNEIDLTDSAGSQHEEQTASHALPDAFSLNQNYPNPFNPTTNIVYNLPVSGEVTVRIFNSIGQEVAILVNRQVQQAGSYNLEWNALNVSSGVYFYRIDVRGANGQVFNDVRRMTLIK
jgi:parallel beta-helix repeat protein